MAYRAYRYGVRVLREHTVPPQAEEQLRRRTEYWNRLVEVDRRYRERMDALLAPFVPADAPDEERRRLRREALGRPEVQAALRQAQQEAYAAQRQLRGASGLYWGNYLDVEQAWATARQRASRQMRFRRPAAYGTLSVHFQDGGLPVAKLFGGSNLLQLEPLPPEVYDAPRATRRKRAWTPFRFRVASDERKQPVWLTGVVCLHRPLPSEGTVRRAHLVVERHHAHPYPRYSLVVVVEEAAGEAAPRQGGRVWGVDVGWRRVEGGLRVALAWSDDGAVHELVLPERLLGAYAWADRFRSGRDQQRNSIRQALAEYRQANQARLPAWLREELAHVGQWQSPGRFRWLVAHWERHAGDEAVYDLLVGWARQDSHLAACVAGAQQRAGKWRENLFGIWLKALLAEARAVVVEDANWRELSQEVDEHGPQGQQRRIASVGRLLERLRQTAEREGVEVVRLPAANTTRRCSWCGQLNDSGPDLVQTCGGCQRQYDQDLNAARNLVQGYASGEVAQALHSDRSPRVSRWRRIREAAERASGGEQPSGERVALAD